MNTSYLYSLLGGLFIGVSVTLMLLMNGRVTGISGILGAAIKPIKGDFAWRFSFLMGLLLGGVLLGLLKTNYIANNTDISNTRIIIAGFFVGFGTLMGSGCTSGHGVCGMSRLSLRSLIATSLFIVSGMITVFLFK